MTPARANLPVLMALLGRLVRATGSARQIHAVLPYAQRLRRFPAYLQQLEMESNGKSGDGSTARASPYHTGPIVWGTAGTNGQHAYYQLLHQGTHIVPMDLIGFVNPTTEIGDHHDLLMANLFAQAEAFAFGKTRTQVVAAACRPTRWTPGCSGQPPDVGHPRRPAHAADARDAGRAVRAQGVRAGRDLGHRLVRPVGRGAGQGPRDAHRGRAHAHPSARSPPSTTRRRRCSSAGSWRGGCGRRTRSRAAGRSGGAGARGRSPPGRRTRELRDLASVERIVGDHPVEDARPESGQGHPAERAVEGSGESATDHRVRHPSYDRPRRLERQASSSPDRGSSGTSSQPSPLRVSVNGVESEPGSPRMPHSR